MSEHEPGSGGKTTAAFLLGVLTGVLVSLGIGGAIALVQFRHGTMATRMAREEAERARAAMMEAEVARREADAARQEALRQARFAQERKGKEKKPRIEEEDDPKEKKKGRVEDE